MNQDGGMSPTVRKNPVTGRYETLVGGVVMSDHETHAQAWRAADRLSGEATTKREATADWVWRKGIDT